MSVRVKTTVHFEPFDVPIYARVYVGIEEFDGDTADLPAVPIEKLEPAALDALAWTWLGNLFASVGRPVPFKLPDDMLAAGPGGDR
jgi:hypothetical protein